MAEARQVYADENVNVEVLADLGRYSNNAYLVSSPRGGGVTIIDAPEGAEAIVEALAGRAVERIVVTHSHFDHWLGFDVLRSHTDAPVYAGAEETELEATRNIERLAHEAVLEVGGVGMRAIHTPGHTPGSTCFYIAAPVRAWAGAGSSELPAAVTGGGVLFTGDTLFPGGPGRTRDHAAFERIVASITSRLHTLPGGTLVLPGHGASTTVARSMEEYAVFAAKEHASDLAGDVLWLES